MYKKERKSRLEMSNDSKSLQYELKAHGMGCEFHGGFWCTHAYLIQDDSPMIRITSDGVVVTNQGWWNKLDPIEQYLASEFIEYVRSHI